MGNPYTGEQQLELAGKKHTIVFDWRAISELKARHTGNIIKTMLDDPEPATIASVLQVGLIRNHPEVTVEQILDASPAIYPTLQALDQALAYAYFGPVGVEESKKNPALKAKKPSLLMRLLKR